MNGLCDFLCLTLKSERRPWRLTLQQLENMWLTQDETWTWASVTLSTVWQFHKFEMSLDLLYHSYSRAFQWKWIIIIIIITRDNMRLWGWVKGLFYLSFSARY